VKSNPSASSKPISAPVKYLTGDVCRRDEDEFGNLGDTSTLADPAAVDDPVNNRQNRSKESA
jgi:hypothetical protein